MKICSHQKTYVHWFFSQNTPIKSYCALPNKNKNSTLIVRCIIHYFQGIEY